MKKGTKKFLFLSVAPTHRNASELRFYSSFSISAMMSTYSNTSSADNS